MPRSNAIRLVENRVGPIPLDDSNDNGLDLARLKFSQRAGSVSGKYFSDPEYLSKLAADSWIDLDNMPDLVGMLTDSYLNDLNNR